MSLAAQLRLRLGELARARRAAGAPAETAPRGAAPCAAGEGATAGRDRGAPPPPTRPEPAPRARIEPVGVEAFLPGGEWRDARGTVWVHERLRSEIEHPRPHWGRLGVAPEGEPDLAALAGVGLERALFLDLETGGLASSPVFLAGTMHWNGDDFLLRQYFARHYGEEATLLGALHEAARGFEVLVTFNGKSYDVPFLRNRAIVHGVPLGIPALHLDLLHAARRRWREVLVDCRLQTLELHVCRRRRAGDVPSDEVPGLYHDYVRWGDPYRLIPVFHHNLLDVVTMAEVLRALFAPAGPGERAGSLTGLGAAPILRQSSRTPGNEFESSLGL